MKVKSFRGGIHPPAYKEITSGQAIVSFPSPGKVFLPLLQHTGSPLLPLVKKGDAVKKGQKIADVDAYISAPLHSPIAGKVVSVEEWPHPMRGKFPSIVIENDGSGREERSVLFSDPDLDKMSIPVLRQWIREGGFVGLGGAAFPTHVKVTPPEGKKIDILILNGAECEPYLTCDHRVMVEKTETVLRGARILRRACEAQKIIIGIEENKPDALEKIRAAIPDMPVPCEVFSLPTQYPQGSEKHLIQTILGKEVPPGGLPLDVGVVVSNVQTAWAIGRKAEEGWPLIERVITISGDCVQNPANIEVPLGVRLEDVVNFCGGFSTPPRRVVMGGPMTGIAQVTLDVPVIKGTSGFVCWSTVREKREYPCIRCGRCVDHCPMYLLPTNLASFVEFEAFDEAQNFRVVDCIECGSCSYVCPSGIPITHLIKMAKVELLRRSRKGGK